MFSKTVEFEDFEGETRAETMYFNLTAPELAKLEFEFDGGIEAYVKKMTELTKDELVELLKQRSAGTE